MKRVGTREWVWGKGMLPGVDYWRKPRNTYSSEYRTIST
jgi:hypothetical protein